MFRAPHVMRCRPIGRLLIAAAMLAAAALATAAPAQLNAGSSAVSEMDTVLSLVRFDRASRTAVLWGPGDIDLRFTVPPEIQMFERVEPGELFSMRHTRVRMHALSKGGVPGVWEAQAAEFAPGSSSPVGRLINTKRVTLRVQEVDRANRRLAVLDANDDVLTLPVDEDEQGLAGIAAGDTITIISIETVELGILPP